MDFKTTWAAAAAFILGMGVGIQVRPPIAQGAEPVATQGPRGPADEARAFHLPPGFEAQLVASEPRIHKPINIAFDDKGRLWVTDTVEYPFPAAEGAPTRDTVKILSDFAPDGPARSIATFADNLNIPIGVLPRRDNAGHDSAIVYSIPGIWRLTDTHNTGKADERTLLVTGQAHDDTHGMTGSFNEGFDGEVYAVHGFRNDSTLRGTDGSSIQMTSGHTYRFRPDGSHLEINTSGQVNPFGMCFDPLGNLYTSDCETMPILLTLRGAYYSSFGRPHDGLGFGPDISDHMYGSSAIAGLLDYVGPNFPAEYQNMMLVGNVVTSKINRAQLTPRGSAFHADDAPDFLTSDDPWFRPVCMKLGPDGAIYVADFYNRIIGHYEVDLRHPGRDKERGRIWRIVYTGKDAAPPSRPFDLTRAEPAELVQRLSDPNFAVRMLAMNYIADCRADLVPLVKASLAAADAPPALKSHGMWVLHRTGGLDEGLLTKLAADASAMVRVHCTRVLAETPAWSEPQRALAIAGLNDSDAMVRRCAADAIGEHPRIENVRPLLDARAKAPAADKHLVHTLRIALRNQLNDEKVVAQLPLTGSTDQDTQALIDVAAGATSIGSTKLAVSQIGKATADPHSLVEAFRHVGRYGTDTDADELTKVVPAKLADDEATQVELFIALREGVAQRKGALPASTQEWGRSLARRLFAKPGEAFGGWVRFTLTGSPPENEVWEVQDRRSADNVTAPFISSLPLGETNTGVIRSKPFAVPASLSFFIAGHNGPPSQKKPGDKNVIRLRAADTNEVLAEAFPPRNDVAQKKTWELGKYVGRSAYIEATDGDTRTAYAWLAFGRFEPAVVRVPAAAESHRLRTAITIAGALRMTEVESQVADVLTNKTVDVETRVAAAKALPELGASPMAQNKLMAAILIDSTAPDALRDAVSGVLQQDGSPETAAAFIEAMRTAPRKLQLSLARGVATTPGGAEALLTAVAAGKASPRLLQDVNVRERLELSHPADLDARAAKLTANLPPPDQATQSLIDSRAKAFDRSHASAERGQKVFQQACAVCHSVGGAGAHVGPQLDGIGTRGVARLAEDILDPSRNVDAAFRYSTYTVDNGDVLAGIPRREEGDSITIADSSGKEVTIARSTVKRVVPSNLSLMPSNFGDALKPADFDDLISYLLSTAK